MCLDICMNVYPDLVNAATVYKQLCLNYENTRKRV